VEVGKKPQSKWPDLVFIGQVQNKCVKECPLEGDDEDRERHGPFVDLDECSSGPLRSSKRSGWYNEEDEEVMERR